MSKLIINGVIVNHKRTITTLVKNNDIQDLKIENIDIFSEMFNLNVILKKDDIIEIFKIMKTDNRTIKKIIDDIKDIGENFIISQYKKYIEFRKKNPNDNTSLNFFLEKYGEIDGTQRRKKLKERITPYNKEFWLKKLNISSSEVDKKILEYKKSKSTSLNGFISRHGKEIGEKKFEKFKETSKHTLEKFIEKYGTEFGLIKWKLYCQKKDSNSVNWAMKKSNGNEEIMNELLRERKESVKTTLTKLIEKYGDEEIALNEFEKIKSKKLIICGNSSKESLKYFIPIYHELLSLNYDMNDIKLGIENNHEFPLYDKENKKTYFYDFTIKSKKIIIEYNGETWHPNYEKYDVKWLNENWKHKLINKNAEYFVNFEKQKIKTAINYGFDVLILWSSDSFGFNDSKIRTFLKQKGIL
jgi:hypothetical protein